MKYAGFTTGWANSGLRFLSNTNILKKSKVISMDLEDKLLGYKAQNYVSSSESEGEDDEDSGRESGGEAKNKNAEETPQLDLRVDGPMVINDLFMKQKAFSWSQWRYVIF